MFLSRFFAAGNGSGSKTSSEKIPPKRFRGGGGKLHLSGGAIGVGPGIV